MNHDATNEKDRILGKMKAEWDARARENGAFYIATINSANETEFHESGERDVYYVFRHLEYLLHPGQVVLDIGCGMGRMDSHIAPRVKRLVGIDISRGMVEGARARLAHLPNVEFLEGDGCSLRPLVDRTFGLVFSHIVFQHMPRELFEAYVAEVRRVLAPRGQFVFQVPEALNGNVPDPALDDSFEMRFHREEDVRLLIQRHGFEWLGVARFRVNCPTIVFDQLRVHARLA